MSGKIILIVLTLGIVGCVLLVNRQQQIEAMHELSLMHQRLNQHEQTLWQLRVDIARRCSPEALRDATGALADSFVPRMVPPTREHPVRQWRPTDRYAYENGAGDAPPFDEDEGAFGG